MADIKPQIESQTGVPKPKPFAPAGHSMYPAATVAMPVLVCIFTCAILMCTYKYSVLHALLCLRIEKVLRTILPQQQWLAARMISVIVLQLPRNAEKIRAALLHSHKWCSTPHIQTRQYTIIHAAKLSFLAYLIRKINYTVKYTFSSFIEFLYLNFLYTYLQIFI